MKVRKNVEAVFLAAVVFVTCATYATAHVPTARQAAKATATATVADTKVAVVVVKAKRMSAEEKAALN